MQSANLTSVASSCADSAGGLLPFGCSDLQARLAALNAGLLGLRSPRVPTPMLTPLPPLLLLTLGSGKSGTPWLRMHREYARAWAAGSLADELPAGLFGVEQAAATYATPASATVIAATRRAGSDLRRPGRSAPPVPPAGLGT